MWKRIFGGLIKFLFVCECRTNSHNQLSGDAEKCKQKTAVPARARLRRHQCSRSSTSPPCPRPHAQRPRRAPRPRPLLRLTLPTFSGEEEKNADAGTAGRAREVVREVDRGEARRPDNVCATLVFAELPIGRRPCASTAPSASLHDLTIEAMNPGSAFAIA